MKITVTLPDEIAEQVRGLPDREEFVARAVETALANRPRPPIPPESAPSKWAKIVERIESRPPSPLGEYADKLARDQKEFRRTFRFKHDEL